MFAIVMAIHLRQPGPLRPQDNREMVKTPQPAPTISHDVQPLQHRAVRPQPNLAQQTGSELLQEARAPRLEVFPTPTPLSDQEKLLLHYMARTPREEIVAHSRP